MTSAELACDGGGYDAEADGGYLSGAGRQARAGRSPSGGDRNAAGAAGVECDADDVQAESGELGRDGVAAGGDGADSEDDAGRVQGNAAGDARKSDRNHGDPVANEAVAEGDATIAAGDAVIPGGFEVLCAVDVRFPSAPRCGPGELEAVPVRPEDVPAGDWCFPDRQPAVPDNCAA